MSSGNQLWTPATLREYYKKKWDPNKVWRNLYSTPRYPRGDICHAEAVRRYEIERALSFKTPRARQAGIRRANAASHPRDYAPAKYQYGWIQFKAERRRRAVTQRYRDRYRSPVVGRQYAAQAIQRAFRSSPGMADARTRAVERRTRREYLLASQRRALRMSNFLDGIPRGKRWPQFYNRYR